VRLAAPTLRTARSSLVSLNRTLPPLRTFAIVSTPAVEALPGLIEASKPWLAQARPLLSGREAGGTARLLSETIPGLADAARAGKSVTLPQLNRLSLCNSKVLVPTGDQVIEDRFSTGGPNYREFLYSLSNFAGAGQNYDGNGPYIRAQAGGGPVLVGEPNPDTEAETLSEDINYGHTIAEPIGNQPQLGGLPPFEPNVRCYTNSVPDLNGKLGQVGSATPSTAGVNP